MRRASLALLLLLSLLAAGAWLLGRGPSPRSQRVSFAPAEAAAEPALAPASAAAEESAAAAAVPSRPLPARAVAAAATPDERSLMDELRAIKGEDPVLAEQLARQGNQLFPGSPDAPERAAILIHALAEQARPMEARGEAEDMVNHYPDSPWVREVEAFTGAHRHREARVDADGRLVFE